MTTPVICNLRLPNQAHLFEHIKANAKHASSMVRPDSREGMSVAICGAGPSLATQFPVGDEVWACNSALPYLLGRNVHVTHGFAIDAGEDMLAPNEFGSAPDVEYLLASSVHPDLTTLLLLHDRRVTFFHSYLGIEDPPDWKRENPADETQSYEQWLYAHLYGSTGDRTVRVGAGLNSVPRAVCLALAMGFSDIYVYGADCACAPAGPRPFDGTPQHDAWLKSLVMYADGRTVWDFAPDEKMAEAELDGRLWHTRVDMIISAQHLAEMAEQYAPRIHLMGDTLPNMILRHPEPEWRDRLPKLTGFGRIENLRDASKEAA